MSLGDKEMVMADIPGLIKGAHKGIGLGTKFLGHIERCSVLLHMIDGTRDNLIDDYLVIRRELQKYGAGLENKLEFIVINKADAMNDEEVHFKVQKFRDEGINKVFVFSSISGKGKGALLKNLFDLVENKKNKIAKELGGSHQVEEKWKP